MKRACISALVVLLAGVPVMGAEIPGGTVNVVKHFTGDMLEFKAPEEVHMISVDEMDEMYELMDQYERPDESLVINRGTYFYYYEHLDPVAKEMYDIMLEIARDPVIEGNFGLMMSTVDPDSDEFFDEWTLAYTGLIYDHPELFWLYTREHLIAPFSTGEYANGVYYVLFALVTPYNEYQEEMTAFNEAAAAVLAQIDPTLPDYEKVCQAHDIITGMCSYDVESLDQYTDDAYTHTAYGMLVKNSRGIENYCVCDGYSLAFEYILQQLGIPVAFNGGIAGSLEEEAAGTLGGHAWNLVMVNDQWYEVDSTWDDNLQEAIEEEFIPGYEAMCTPGYVPDDYFLEMVHDEDYLDRLSHFLFMISTEEMQRFIIAEHEDLYYTSSDGQFRVSLLEGNDKVHIRLDPVTDGVQGKLLSLAPVAEHAYAE